MKVHELQHLAAAMAHEVRNPLNSMAIHVELLESRLRKEGADPATLKSLGVLSDEIERVDKILEQYLGYAGPTEAARSSVAAKALLGGIIEGLRPQADARGVQLTLDADGGAWAVDATALRDALSALGENAIAATPKGSTVAFTARTLDETEQAEITITDSAPPIADSDLTKVFHMGSTRSAGQFGLTVAKQIIKGHGGSIIAKKRDGGGNLFTIRLPLDLDDDGDDE